MKTKESVLYRFLTSPLLWGGAMSAAFYTALHQGLIGHPLLLRYFAGHPIEYITTIMFFIGVASLTIKWYQLRGERYALHRGLILGEREAQRVDIRKVDSYLKSLSQFETKYGRSVLSNRLRVALQFVGRCGSVEELDTELRYLGEEDAAKADTNYGLVRLILWAMPMIGFLGTVVGITMALGNLDLNAINESSKMLSAGLSVAFDTTALAIGLDLVLYFFQFLVYREESHLLWQIDKRVDQELRGRFELIGHSGDTVHVIAVRRMLETTVTALENLLQQQTRLWEHSMELANERFSQLTEQNAEILKKSLVSALSESISDHAGRLIQGETQLLERTGSTVEKFSETLRLNADSIQSLQQGTVRQTEAIRGVVQASTQLAQLEENLTKNLAALAQVGNFEETVNSLAAVIHLLNGKNQFRQIEKGSAA